VVLARQNAYQERLVRRTLLKVLPAQQKQGGRSGVLKAVEEVESAVVGWISGHDRPGFSSELQGAVDEIAVSWSRIQTLEEIVLPQFDPSYSAEWKPLPAPPSAEPAGTTGTQLSQKGARGRSKQVAGKQEATGQKPPPAAGPVTIPVWPSFTYISANGEKHLYTGFGLAQSQLIGAEEEVSRRMARRLTREERLATPMADRDLSFLSGEPSDGALDGPSAASDGSGSA
jgi:hypothetical protein